MDTIGQPIHRFAGVFAAAVGLTLAIPSAGAAATDGASSFSGTWTYVGDDVEAKARRASIEAATADLPFFVRGRARDRLRTQLTPVAEISIALSGDRVTLSSRGKDVSLRLGGPPVTLEQDGKRANVSARLDGPRMVVVSQGENGEREVSYAVSSDGRRLTLAVRMKGERLAQPVAFTSTYRRK